MVGDVLARLGRMIMLHRLVPALVRGVKVEQKPGGIAGIVNRIKHVGEVREPVRMPFGIHLHAAYIDTVTRRGNRVAKIGQRRLTGVEEQPLAAVIQGPGPGHILAGDHLAAGLNAGDALHQACRNAVYRFRTSGFGKTDIVKGCHALASLRGQRNRQTKQNQQTEACRQVGRSEWKSRAEHGGMSANFMPSMRLSQRPHTGAAKNRKMAREYVGWKGPSAHACQSR